MAGSMWSTTAPSRIRRTGGDGSTRAAAASRETWAVPKRRGAVKMRRRQEADVVPNHLVEILANVGSGPTRAVAVPARRSTRTHPPGISSAPSAAGARAAAAGRRAARTAAAAAAASPAKRRSRSGNNPAALSAVAAAAELARSASSPKRSRGPSAASTASTARNNEATVPSDSVGTASSPTQYLRAVDAVFRGTS